MARRNVGYLSVESKKVTTECELQLLVSEVPFSISLLPQHCGGKFYMVRKDCSPQSWVETVRPLVKDR